jgi:ferritin-like metal-binding protein YciE
VRYQITPTFFFMEIIKPAPLEPHLQYKVFVHNLNRIYFAKTYLDKKMPNLIEMASFKGLELGMNEFWEDVKKQISRMNKIYKLINEIPSDKNCNPLKAIIKDEFCLDQKHEIAILNDMDLIMYMQMLEHINIACYGLLKVIASQLKYQEIEQLLKECFDECVDNDQLFVLIAKEYVQY